MSVISERRASLFLAQAVRSKVVVHFAIELRPRQAGEVVRAAPRHLIGVPHETIRAAGATEKTRTEMMIVGDDKMNVLPANSTTIGVSMTVAVEDVVSVTRTVTIGTSDGDRAIAMIAKLIERKLLAKKTGPSKLALAPETTLKSGEKVSSRVTNPVLTQFLFYRH